MNLIDNINLETGIYRPIADTVNQLPDIINPSPTGSIHFNNIDMAVPSDRLTMSADTTRFRCRTSIAIFTYAIKGPRNDAGGTSFTDTADTRQNKCMGQSISMDGIGQGPHHSVLTNQFSKGPGPVLPGENTIRLR